LTPAQVHDANPDAEPPVAVVEVIEDSAVDWSVAGTGQVIGGVAPSSDSV